MTTLTGTDRALAQRLDTQDPLRALRAEFLHADPDTVYLDGNSLGRLPTATPGHLRRVIVEGWGSGLVRSWETWIDWSTRLGDRLAAHLLGAAPGEVAVADSASVNLFKLAAAALDARPDRHTILMDPEDFPTNRYLLQGLAQARGLRLVELAADPIEGLHPDVLRAALTEDVALVALSLVSYRSGALLDLAQVNRDVHAAGALMLWDLSHAVGALPIELAATGADLAVGTTYKYLNGGPGSPAFLYVRADLHQHLRQPIWGWYGQRDMFAMGPRYDPVEGIDRFQVATPPLLSLAAVEPALDVIERVPISGIRAKSVRLGQFTVELARQWLAPHGVTLASPADPARRGSHISLAHPEAALISRALREQHRVICDFRAPDRLRIGLAPLYTSFTDVWDGLHATRTVLATRSHHHLPAATPKVT